MKLGGSGIVESVILRQGLANSFGGLGLQEITTNRRFHQLCLRDPVVFKPQLLNRISCTRDPLSMPDFALHVVINLDISAISQLLNYAQITEIEVQIRGWLLFIIC